MSDALKIQKLESEVKRLEDVEKDLKQEIGLYELQDNDDYEEWQEAVSKLEKSLSPDGLLVSEMKIDLLKEHWEKISLKHIEDLVESILTST